MSAYSWCSHCEALPETSARKGGTGLGLAVAQELVTAHGGTIRLLDTANGASFEIDIPDRHG